MIHEFNKPIPVITEHGKGYAIYVESLGLFSNDVFCVCLCDGGIIKHYTTKQIKIEINGTFGIIKNDK